MACIIVHIVDIVVDIVVMKNYYQAWHACTANRPTSTLQCPICLTLLSAADKDLQATLLQVGQSIPYKFVGWAGAYHYIYRPPRDGDNVLGSVRPSICVFFVREVSRDPQKTVGRSAPDNWSSKKGGSMDRIVISRMRSIGF